MHSLEVKLATPAHWARVSNILHNILERILMYVIASWPLVLATCALLRHVNVNEANMNGDHFTTVHCVIIMELDEATLMDGTAPLVWHGGQCPFTAGVPCRSLTDTSYLEIKCMAQVDQSYVIYGQKSV